MDSTRLTIGGLTQPGVARHLIELPSNTEKGLSHCFVWLFPKPLYGEFESLGTIDRNFIDKTGNLILVSEEYLTGSCFNSSEIAICPVEESITIC